ncbi:TIGR02281 family clan AA aspartic protease [Geothrix sp. 21YS21S-4]|uniref:retropepsin-like aspartic protease family protein n=1 Tax=Geothrix sp. 21YS21S-4 TaxID=3068889 RepID=UPI0027B90B1B|nr:retropepsin-like aspartic protease [Geothrix sp. 21YS21S-4]
MSQFRIPSLLHVLSLWLTLLSQLVLFGKMPKPTPTFNTPLGVVAIQGATDYEKTLTLNGHVLIRDYIIDVYGVFPSEKDPKILFIHNASGGNACCWSDNILDLTGNAPILLKDIAPPLRGAVNKVFTLTPRAVIYQANGKTNGPLGEPILELCQYTFGVGRVETKRSVPQFNSLPMKEKRFAHEIFNDPINRKPLLDLLGPKGFKDLRSHMEVSSGLIWLTESLVWATGCTSHSCTISEGAFLLETRANKAWAISFDSEGKRFFGSKLNPSSPGMRAIDDWLKVRHLFWGSFSFIRDQSGISAPIKGARHSVPLTLEGGVLTVQVTLNDTILLDFIIDSGASDVVVPADVVLTLMRTGTLSPSDFIGSKTYRLADGTLVPSKIFRLKRIKIGDRVIENVTATLTGVEGSLLLGQSFLSRLGKWSIDNAQRIIEIE